MKHVFFLFWIFFLSGCYSSSTSNGDEECLFLYQDDKMEDLAVCTINISTTRPCEDMTRCFCEAWLPDASDMEINLCVVTETSPDGETPIHGFCNANTELSLEEVLQGLAEVSDADLIVRGFCHMIPGEIRLPTNP